MRRRTRLRHTTRSPGLKMVPIQSYFHQNLGFGRRSASLIRLHALESSSDHFAEILVKDPWSNPKGMETPPCSEKSASSHYSLLYSHYGGYYPTYSYSVSFYGLRVPHELPASLHTGIVPPQYASKLGSPVQSQFPTQHRLAVPISEEPLQALFKTADLPRSRRSNTDPLLFERKGLLLLRYNYWMRCHLRNPLSEAFLIIARVAKL